jgi:hypothetical protein
MIVRQELGGWLESRERQQATAARADLLRRKFHDDPAFAEFRRDVAALDGSNAAALLDAGRAFFDRVGNLAPLLEELVSASAADPFFHPPFKLVSTELHSGLLLFDSPQMVVSLGVVRLEPLAAKKAGARGPSSIMFNAQWTLLRLIHAGDALFSFWEAPPILEGFAADRAGKCRLVERRRMKDGETLLLDGRSQSFVIENARDDLVLLQANVTADAGPLMVEYDSQSLDFVAASSANESGSRLEMMVSLLRLLDDRRAIPWILEAVPTSAFHARWHIMRELLAWDAEAALPGLQAMASADPHPEVRSAARQTLEIFFQPAETDGRVSCHA